MDTRTDLVDASVSAAADSSPNSNPARYNPTRRAFVATSAAAAAAAAVLPRGALADAAASEAPASEVVIFHTNDTHGYLQGDDKSVVGIDYVAGLRATVPGSLLVDAGDATQGAPLASLTKGQAPIQLMNDAGYDAMCLGNHEFDFGLDVLLTNAQGADFPLLAANALNKETGEPLLKDVANASDVAGNGCWTVLESAGRRIGVFGLVTQATAWSVMPSYVADVTFADEVSSAESCISELAEQGVDAIVALCHMGDGAVPCKAIDLAASLPADAAAHLTAIIDGHSHTVENTEVNGILVVQTGCNLANVGKLTLTFSDDGSVTAAEELLDPAAVAGEAAPDAQTTATLEAVAAEQQEMLSVEICPNPTTLWGGWIGDGAICAPTRMVETNFGDVTCEAFAAAARDYLQNQGDESTPVVAIENGGGVRAALPRGMVTKGDLVMAFPFSNTLMVKQVTPRLLRAAMEASLSTANGQDGLTGMLLQTEVSGSFSQLSGFWVEVDPNAVVGQRVTAMGLADAAEPLDLEDDETPLVLVSNSYIMTGGGYEEIGTLDLMAEIGGELEAIENYLSLMNALNGGEGLPLRAGTAGNLRFVGGGYAPTPWTATLRLVDADGNALAGQAAVLQVDAGDVVAVESDADGLVQVDLEDGPHSIALVALGSDAGEPASDLVETYVDNYMGIGLVEDDLRAFPQLTAE